MLINNKILPGEELFKFLEYILKQNNVQVNKNPKISTIKEKR